MLDVSNLQKLLKVMPLPPEEKLPEGATNKDIVHLEQALGEIPDDLKEWLLFCNGPCVGPGGIFGINTEREYLDILYHFELHPQWKSKRWTPVAGDGCGNYYVLDASTGKAPILFIDTMGNPDESDYIVASNLEKFLTFLFESELNRTNWPFDKDEVTKLDPDIFVFSEYKKPWE